MLKGIVCVLVAVTATACAARGSMRHVQPPSAPPPDAVDRSPVDPSDTPSPRAGTFAVRARPPSSTAQTVEAADPALANALLNVALWPMAVTHRAVADAYARLGILDKAHEHLTAAVTIDPRDAVAWDARARLWRDWGLLHFGLGDASRAIYFAPESPEAHNTMGTVLQALGRHSDALMHYEKALQLDATAAYAQYNAGTVHLARQQYASALQAFEAAQQLRPGFPAAEAMARRARAQVEWRHEP